MNPSGRSFLSLTSSKLRVVLAVFVVLAVLLFWWWPGLVGAGDPSTEPDVLVIANGQVAVAKQVVSRRLLEEGFTVGWGETPSDWCAVVDALGRGAAVKPRRAVVLYVEVIASSALCQRDPSITPASIVSAIDAMYDVRVLVVTGLTATDHFERRVWEESGATVVDPSNLLADSTKVGEHVDCLWWDDCLIDEHGLGYVVLRDANGLTIAGQQRLARVLVAEVQ